MLKSDFTVGPESRSVKRKMADKTWVFKFPYNVDNVLDVKVAYVCTFKNEDAIYDQSENDDRKIVLSVRRASLLALCTMNRITDLCMALVPPVAMLTPLCGAIFSRHDIPVMARGLQVTEADLIKILNSSCQSGGQYLEQSTLTVAALASIVATQKLGAKGKADERSQIITKVI